MAQFQHYRGVAVLLPLIGIAAGALELNSAVIFIFNLIALIPLGSWINRSVDALSVNGRRTVNEILKSTLGNSVELMVISCA
jgi:Ca2+:H+ antiporter